MITESEYLAAKQIVMIYEREQDKTLYWKLLVDEWFRFYHEQFGTDPNFTNGEQPALKRLMKKIRKKAEAAKMEWTEQTAVSSLHIILKKSFEDKWLKDHFTLKNTDNQFDSTYARSHKQSPHQKNRDLDAQIEALVGTGQHGRTH